MILGIIVTLQNHGTPAAQIFFLHVNITFQVGGEDAFYKLGQESVFVWTQVELCQFGGQDRGPGNKEKTWKIMVTIKQEGQ